MPLTCIRSVAILALASTLSLCAGPAFAQKPPQAPTAPQTLQAIIPRGALEDPNARRTRDQLNEIVRKYPPSLGVVLKLDPSLLTNRDYLAPYPVMAAFVSEHPEILRNPAFYFDSVHVEADESRNTPTSDHANVLRDLFGWIAGISVTTVVATTIAYLVRLLVDYRRWYRGSKLQSDAHSKLLDRLTSNSELLAYVQSSAGSRFLESTPISFDSGARPVGAPFSRILWSAQVGTVLAVVGLGVEYVSARIAAPSTAQVMFGLGVLILSLGIGFLVSAGVSYGLSHRLGLLKSDAPKTE